MILWHVRFDIANQTREFKPRPPFSPMRNEDKETARVCVATSIEGAISASPSGSKRLSTSLEIQDGLFYAFRIDTEKLQLNNVVFPEDLVDNYGVEDALLTGECWLQESFVVDPEDVVVYKAIDWEIDKYDSPSGQAVISIVKDLKISLAADKQAYIDNLSKDDNYLHSYGRLSLLYNDHSKIMEIIRAFEDGFSILQYVSPAFDALQIHQIRQGFLDGVDGSLYADHRINYQNMVFLRKALGKGLDISKYLDPELSYVEISDYIKQHETKSMSFFN